VSAITDIRVGDAGAQALAKALESNTTLTTLNVDGAFSMAEMVAVFAVES
jgi:hypothetical protein